MTWVATKVFTRTTSTDKTATILGVLSEKKIIDINDVEQQADSPNYYAADEYFLDYVDIKGENDGGEYYYYGDYLRHKEQGALNVFFKMAILPYDLIYLPEGENSKKIKIEIYNVVSIEYCQDAFKSVKPLEELLTSITGDLYESHEDWY